MTSLSGNNILRARLTRCHGATVLFVAGIILPLFFLLFSVSLDASRYMTETQKVQKLLDDAASASYRYLPFQADAQRAARDYLSRYAGLMTATTISTDGDSIALLYSAPSLLTFPRFFGIEASIPVTAYAKVRGAPFDTLILLDTSSYLGPDLLNGTAWGDPGAWPAASFFSSDYVVVQEGAPLDSRLVTQQCFNPAFSSLKRAAITASEYLSRLSQNSLGIGVFPGAGVSVSSLRQVIPASTRPIGPGEVDFEYYLGTVNRNELCAAAAEHELSSSEYQFPAVNPKLPSIHAGGTPPVNITLPDAAQGTWILNPEYVPFIEARQSLWSEARRENSIADTAAVLREVRSQLLGAPYREERGGLALRPIRTAFVFAGDVPHANAARFPEPAAISAISAQLSALRDEVISAGQNTTFKLVYIVFRHPGNDGPDFDLRVSALADLFARERQIDGQDDPRLEYQLVFASSGETLLSTVLGPVLYTKRTAILSR